MDQASGDAANHHNKKGSSNGAASSDSAASSSRTTPTNAAQQAQAAAAAAALGLIDPSALFAHSLFASGIPASYNPMAPMPGYGMMGQGGPSPFGPSSSSNSDAAAQAAWWNMASQMAAQDYLTRLQHAAVASASSRSGSTSSTTTTFPGMSGFPGMSAADSLLASYTSAMNAAGYPGSSGNKSSSSRSSKSSSVVVRDSLSNQPTPSTSSGGSGKSRIPDPKFTMPNESALRKSSSSSSKNRRRAATTSGSTEASSSSLSSLSSMAMSYPFFGNPLASLSMPGMAAAAAASGASSPYPSGSSTPEDKKRRKTERHSSSSSDPSIQLLRLPGNVNNNTTNNNSSKVRSQTVNGKPLALDVSSLIGKPSSSTSPAAATAATTTESSGEAPLNLSMKTTTTPKEESHSTGSSRLGRGVSMPKKNTVASLLAQSRNQRSTSPHNNSTNPPAAHAASSGASSLSTQPSASELKAMSENLALYTAMQELTSGKLSSAYLNGIKDSLTPNNHQGNSADPNQAIQDLLRAASLLGGFSFGPADPAASGAAKNKDGAKESSKSTENGQSNKNGKSSHDDTHSDDSDSMEEDDSMIDSDDGWAGTGEGSDSRKRGADGGDGSDDRPSKRRRFVSDEAALRIPLTLGWKRETLIRAIGKSGVRGEVTYYSPSGRRFRQYPDVVRYLERQGIGTITRDNFSFSTRCIVGEFIQPLGESPNSRGIRLGEPEVRHLVDQIRIARGWKPRSRRMTEEEKEAIGRQRESQRAAQRVEAQEAARQAQEAKLQQRMERERALQEAKEVRRQMREQEKLERQEAMRKERELRNQQALEARKKRQEELDRLREEEQQRKLAELNKQRELFYTAELERERKRQHTAIVKALEARKRYEDRERKREELRAEKRAEREKKLEERRKELESWRDQRSPTEDLALLDHKPFPDVPRITHLKLAGKAFADILMLYEFLHSFGESLGFDMESLPSLDSFQRALLYDSEAEEVLLSVTTHLLVCAIKDPGIPHPNRHTTLLGQTLKQMFTQLAMSDLQLRALNLGQDRYRRRIWILPQAGGVHCKAPESEEATAGPLITWDGKTAPPIGPLEDLPLPVMKKEIPEVKPELEEEKEAITANGTEPTPAEGEKKSEDPPADPVEVKKEEEVVDALPALWFNILPRIPCDDYSFNNALERDPTEEDLGADGRPKKEEVGVKEEVDKSEMVPIPEAMSRGWWRIIDPEKVKTFLESLHPGGVRENELRRMLLRFMDFAKESCLEGSPKRNYICSKPGSKPTAVLCDQCPKAYHMDGLQPTLAKMDNRRVRAE